MFSAAQVKAIAELVHKLAEQKNKDKSVKSGLVILKRINDMKLSCAASINCEVHQAKFVLSIFLIFTHLDDAKQAESLFRQEITALQKRRPIGIEPQLVQRSHTEIETRYTLAP